MLMKQTRHSAKCIGFALLALLLLSVNGCGPSRGNVTGKVSYQGRPLAWGTVVLIASDQMAYHGAIHQDGTYTIRNVPTGMARVGIASADPYPAREPSKAAQEELEARLRKAGREILERPARGTWFAIPAKYGDPQTSGVTTQIATGTATLNFDLE
jgi:hypothetical protein